MEKFLEVIKPFTDFMDVYNDLVTGAVLILFGISVLIGIATNSTVIGVLVFGALPIIVGALTVTAFVAKSVPKE